MVPVDNKLLVIVSKLRDVIEILRDLGAAYFGSPVHQAALLFSYLVIFIIVFKPDLPLRALKPLKLNENLQNKLVIWIPVILSIVLVIIKIIYYLVVSGPAGEGTDAYGQIKSAKILLSGASPYSQEAFKTTTTGCMYPPLYMALISLPLTICDHVVGIYIVYSIFVPITVYLSVKLASKIFKNNAQIFAFGLTLIILPLFWKGADRNFNALLIMGVLLSILFLLSAKELIERKEVKRAKRKLLFVGVVVGILASIRFPLLLPFFAMLIIFPSLPKRLRLNSFIACIVTFGLIHLIYYIIFGWESIYYPYIWPVERVGGLSWLGAVSLTGVDVLVIQKFLPLLFIGIPILYAYWKKISWLPVLVITMCGMYLSTAFLTDTYLSWFTPLIILYLWKLGRRARMMLIVLLCLLSATVASIAPPTPLSQLVAHPIAVEHMLGVITMVLLVIILLFVIITARKTYKFKVSL